MARVRVVTSDGYEASGQGDPVTAAHTLALLDDFTWYLQNRVQTRNMELLRRLGADFVCQRETTLREFVHIGACLISVLPFEHDEPARWRPAAVHFMAKPKPAASIIARSRALFHHIEACLATKNVGLLRQMFLQFCQRREEAMLAFIAAHCEVVSLLPVFLPVTAQASPLGAMLEPDSFAPFMTDREHPQLCHLEGPAGRKEKKKRRKEKKNRARAYIAKVTGSPRDSQMYQRSPHYKPQPTTASSKPKPSRRSSQAVLPSSRKILLPPDVHDTILRVYHSAENQEPWRQLYQNLPLPFEEARAPTVAFQLRFFWAKHGHAVWERNFWRPIHGLTDRAEDLQRANRQRQATKAFQNVIYLAYEALGPEFFLHLDALPQRHPGWWYRPLVVELWSLAVLVGGTRCAAYITDQMRERFPDCGQPLPLKSANAGVVMSQRCQMVSRSMWLQTRDAKADEIRASVQRLQRRREEAASASASSSSSTSASVSRSPLVSEPMMARGDDAHVVNVKSAED